MTLRYGIYCLATHCNKFRHDLSRRMEARVSSRGAEHHRNKLAEYISMTLYKVGMLGFTHKYSRLGVPSNVPASRVVKSLPSSVLVNNNVRRHQQKNPGNNITARRPMVVGSHVAHIHDANENMLKHTSTWLQSVFRVVPSARLLQE